MNLPTGVRGRIWEWLVRLLPSPRASLRIVTASDVSHERSLVQLLESIRRLAPASSVVVYDLGLSSDGRQNVGDVLASMRGATLKTFHFGDFPDHFRMEYCAGSYAWKPACIEMEIGIACEDFLLWLDAGNVLVEPLDRVMRAIASSYVWSPKSAGSIREWTHPSTVRKFCLTSRQQRRRNLNGAIVGVDLRVARARFLVSVWALMAKDIEWIAPDGSSRSNHRQDQSLLSCLAVRFGIQCVPNGTLGILTHQDVE